MALRLIETNLPLDARDELAARLERVDITTVWFQALDEENMLARTLVAAERTQDVLDLLQDYFSSGKDFRVLVYPIEASLPLAEVKEESPQEEAEKEPEKIFNLGGRQVSREEIYVDVQDSGRFSLVFLVMIALSTLVAAFGLWRDNLPAVIGAMLIAPMLGPIMSLSLSATLADLSLARSAALCLAAGVALALLVAAVCGFWLPLDPESLPNQLATRTQVSLADLILALAAGTAGALAFTSAVSEVIVGVMVATAMMPPLAAAGMLMGAGMWTQAGTAGLLFAINLISVNLAAVVTFWVQGLTPHHYWKQHRARRTTLMAVSAWVLLLALLVVAILLLHYLGEKA